MDCDDGDPCTIDTCVDGACIHTPMDCDDGDPCTIDTCVDGACVHTPIPYTLTIDVNPPGAGTATGEGPYDCGTDVAITANPEVGYRFVNWSGDVSTIADVNSASTNITMNGDYSITANFVRQYSLSINSTAGGNVTTPGEGTFTYDEGTVVNLVAQADECYEFVNWTGDVGTIADVNSASTNITMNGDYSITANFALLTYNLTVSSTTGGNVTVPGEGTFTRNCGEVVDLVAVADEGYRFVNWSGDVSTIANVNSASTNITMNGDYEITARFAEVVACKTETVTNSTLNAMTEANTQVLVTGNATVTACRFASNPGADAPTGLNALGKYIDVHILDVSNVTEVEIRLYYTAVEVTTAGIDEGSLQLRWWNGTAWKPCSPSGVNTTDTSDYSGFIWAKIGANTTPSLADLQGTPFGGFGSPPGPQPQPQPVPGPAPGPGPAPAPTPTVKYSLTVSSTEGGSVTSPGEGTFTYNAGKVVSLVAKADKGYRFVNWTGDVSTVANVNSASTTITMNGNYSITANFIKQYEVTISSGAGGSVTTPGEGKFTYDKGTVVNLVAVADQGYRFVNWTGDVSTVANTNAASTTVTMNGDYSIRANFAVVYELTISSTAGGSVTTPGLGTFIYDQGAVVNLVARPDQGFRFVRWTGDVGTVADVNSASTTITMNDDYSIRADFEKAPAPANWPLIGGIIGAVVAVGLVIFFVRRRRAA
jgi:hypothetical protein